jgi:cytochrome P450
MLADHRERDADRGTGPRAGRSAQPPGPPGSFLWRILPALKDPLRFLLDLAGTYGDIVTVRANRTYLVNRPDLVKHVLQDNHFNYTKGARYRRALEPFFGRGLLTSEGDLWRRQRRQIQPAFHKHHHQDYAGAIVTTTQEYLATWRRSARTGEPLDVRAAMTDVTLAVLMKTIFGRSAGEDIDAVGRAFLAAHGEMNLTAAFIAPPLPQWVPTPGHRRFTRAIRTIDAFIARLVAERRAEAASGTGAPGLGASGLAAAGTQDFLSLLLAARDPDSGEPMSDTQVRDEVITMLAAGHDTVTEALTWTLYLLAQHPDIAERVRQEVSTVLGSREPRADDLAALPFVGCVVHESMRLYPPIWGLMRTTIAADEIDGYALPPDARVIISPYVVHRSPALWPEPDRFLPDRFAQPQAEGRHRFAYFPFGAGPRLCVGAAFAMLEVPLVTTMLIRAFSIQLVPGQTIRALPGISLRADRPVWVTLREQTQA